MNRSVMAISSSSPPPWAESPGADSSPPRTRLVVPAVFAVLLLVGTAVFFASADDRGKSARLTADAWYYHAYLPSLWIDGDLDFTNEYRITNNWYRFGTAPTGKPRNVFGIGPAVFELPLFAAGRVLAHLGDTDPNGFSATEVKASLLASLLFTLGGLYFVYRLLRRRLGSLSAALAAPILLALAGPAVYYAIRQPGYAHPFAMFFTAWLIDAWDGSYARTQAGSPRRLRTWLLLGALLGAAALARPQVGLWGVILAWAAIDDIRCAGSARGAARCAGRWLAGAGLCLLVFLPQLLAWQSLSGSWFAVPQGAGFMRWDAPAWSEVLMSSRNGLFPWAPLYALAALGLFAGAGAGLHRLLAASATVSPSATLSTASAMPARLAAALLAGVALQVVVNGAVWDWWAGGSFGGRRFDSCFAAFAYGLGIVLVMPFAWLRSRPRVRTGLVSALAVLSAILALGNLVLAGKTSAHTARIYGGQPAAEIFRASVPRPVSTVVAFASRAANLPARAVFALRHDTSLGAYDRVVGVHRLHELYPGLNSIPPKRRDELRLANPRAPYLIGFAAAPGGVALAGTKGRILIGLNRRHGPVDLALSVSAPGRSDAASGAAPAQIPVTLAWNGAAVASRRNSAGRDKVTATLESLQRGVNVLEIAAPPGTVVHTVELSVAPSTPP